MRVFQTDKDGFFVGEVTARPDPMMPGAFLIPSGCVLDEPPAAGAQLAARRVGDVWQVVPDIVGASYWDADGKPQKIGRRGEGLPAGGSWNEPAAVAAARIEREQQFLALSQLVETDLASIRAMREYIVAKADAPQWLKNHEATAQTMRGKLA